MPLGIRGLSPRVRGNPPAAPPGPGGRGSIPARAGEPGCCDTVSFSARVYPRACGGTRRPRWDSPHVSGLSPRVRGNPGRGRGWHAAGGSIPARAGEPSPAGMTSMCSPVYPRACGGTGLRLVGAVEGEGLSPRVRGNLHDLPGGGAHARSIPARAGEPCIDATPEPPAGVYPRACGGTSGRPSSSTGKEGLSPRVRGNLQQRHVGAGAVGSIPARAGEPIQCPGRKQDSQVYPRACGGTSLAVS